MIIQLQGCLTSFAPSQPIKVFSLLCLCYFFWSSAFSQTVSKTNAPQRKIAKPASVYSIKAPRISITNFSAEEGLALSGVFSSLKDSNGNLWFGTMGGGVSKYDGRSFETFNSGSGLAHNLVMGITEDRQGNLWFGTLGGGVSRFDGIAFSTLTSRDGLANNMVVTVFEDSKGSIWFGTFDGGVTRYDGRNFKTFTSSDGLANDSIWSIAEDEKGILYFGTDNGVSTYDGKSFSSVAQLKDKSVRSILVDSHRNLWFGTVGDGVIQISANGTKRYTTADGLPDNSIWDICEDRVGQIWFSTEAGGVCSFNGKDVFKISSTQGLSNDNVTSIIEDNHGSMWFTTFGGGVDRFEGRAVYAYETGHGLSNSKIRNVTEDQEGNLWIGTFGGGVSRFDGQYFVTYDTTSGLPSNFIRTILQTRDGSIWIGSHGGGITKFNGSTFTNYNVSHGLANNNVRALFEDTAGKLWIGTDNGLTVFDGVRFQTFRQQDGLSSPIVWDVLQDRKGNYWFGSYGGGVNFYDGKSFTTYDTGDGLCSNSILCLHEDANGNIWIGGASGGITRFDGKSFFTLTSAHGLPDETVYDIVEDTKGELWIGTNLGVTKVSFIAPNSDVVNAGLLAIDNEVLKSSFKPKFDVHNNATGYAIKDVNTNAMCIVWQGFRNSKQGLGVIWAGCGDDKLIRFDPSAVRSSISPPKVVLKTIKLNEQNLSWYGFQQEAFIDSTVRSQREMFVYGRVLSVNDRTLIQQSHKNIHIKGVMKFSNVPEGLSLPHSLNRLTFDFNAIETSRYNRINYQYKLEGQDERWSPVVKTSEVTYSNLWEGDYVFNVRAQSADGIWSEPVKYSFTIRPPWWRQPWMYLLYTLIFAMAVMLVVKMRERKLRHEKRILEAIVDQRTNEVVDQMKTAELQKHEAQRQRLEAERQRQLVEEKNSEIMAQLTNTEASLSGLTLEMIERFHTYTELEHELRRLADNNDPSKFKRVFSLITTNKSLDREWEQFNLFFDGIYKGFNNKLRGRAQQLSNYDLRLCALIKMGFENREIAMLLNIEVTSVKMAKYRLRKKLQIEEQVDLQQYFETL